MNNYPENNIPTEETEAPLPMGWYKFLCYFSLWLSALVNFTGMVSIITGGAYERQGISPVLAYVMFPGLQDFDIFRVALYLASVVLVIITAVSLLKYKAIGPKLLLIVYGFNGIASVISYVGEYCIVNAVTSISFDASIIIPNLGISLAMVIINHKYFSKRAHLFNR